MPSLLTYLTTPTLEGHEDIKRDTRLRTFMHVFFGCPKNADSEDTSPDPEAAPKLSKFVHKLNACASHLEQVSSQTQFPSKGRILSSIALGSAF